MKKLLLLLLCLLHSGLLFAQQEQSYALRRVLWKSNKISVCWDNPTEENKAMRLAVQQAVKDTWEKHSALQFTDWVPAREKDADIHIYIADDGPHTKGLGTELKNKPQGMVLNFTFNNWSRSCRSSKEFCIKAIAVHEFGHAIGFAHEQNRDDCDFPDCLGKEQGSDGDWYVTACDLSSIMNYCNPKWSNDGLLSPLDIAGVQALYGKPVSEAPARDPLRLVHTANQIARVSGKRISHEFKVYVAGSEAQQEKITKVVYHLHPTFKRPTMTSTNANNNFGIGLRVWGEFAISADVYKGDGTRTTLHRFLDFDGNGVEQGQQPKVGAAKSRTNSKPVKKAGK